MRRGPVLWYTVTSLLLKQLKQHFRLHSGFRNHIIFNLSCSNAVIILVLFFHIVFVISLTFPLMLKTFLLFIVVAILPSNQSPVNCRSRNVEGNTQNELPLPLSFSRPWIYVATSKHTGLVLSRMRRWYNSQNNLLLGKL